MQLNVQHNTNIHPDGCNGITLYQIRGLWANVEWQCGTEGWKDWNGVPLMPETLNLKNVDKYVVKLFTKATRKSLVAYLPSSGKYQVPRIFISAPFILPIGELVLYLEAFIHYFRTNFSNAHEKRGGMTEHTPVLANQFCPRCMGRDHLWKRPHADTNGESYTSNGKSSIFNN